MSNVIRLSDIKAQPQHVLIETGWMPSQQARGFEVKKYFVSVVEPNGEITCVWDGPTHKDAIEQARLWELPVVDNAGKEVSHAS